MTEHENPTQEVCVDNELVKPPGWARAFWPSEVIALLEAGLVTEISLDYDHGDSSRTGYDMILWLDDAVASRGFVPPRIAVHSANPAAAARMRAGFEVIVQLVRRNSNQSQSRRL